MILGLIKPIDGSLKAYVIDEKSAWAGYNRYVPQSIYLSDDTIEANIAFGENLKRLTMKLLKEYQVKPHTC